MVGMMMLAAVLSAQTGQTLEVEAVQAALEFARANVRGTTITISSDPPAGSSGGVEGWTTFGDDGRATGVFVYSKAAALRCATLQRSVACLSKLASIVVHEMWHFEHGPSEAGAYNAQIAFLKQAAAPPQIVGLVIAARDEVLSRVPVQAHQIYRESTDPAVLKGR